MISHLLYIAGIPKQLEDVGILSGGRVPGFKPLISYKDRRFF